MTVNPAVVIPCPSDPNWRLFDAIPAAVPIIVVDDSPNGLDRKAMPSNVSAVIPSSAELGSKSAASRNAGHLYAYHRGYDPIIALDYDCKPGSTWLAWHLESLQTVKDSPALRAEWVNTITSGCYARGFPYEQRNLKPAAPTFASGEVKLNMGVWRGVLDIDGIDRVGRTEQPTKPGEYPVDGLVALGMLPICGMNVAFRAELVPAYFFLPDVEIPGWRMALSRHDDIWGGYVLKRLMDKRGDLVSFGHPVVEHTRLSNLDNTLLREHYGHLMSSGFYECVDWAVEFVRPGPYAEMFAEFVFFYDRAVDLSQRPAHYRAVYSQLAIAMKRWSACFA